MREWEGEMEGFAERCSRGRVGWRTRLRVYFAGNVIGRGDTSFWCGEPGYKPICAVHSGVTLASAASLVDQSRSRSNLKGR